MKDKIKNIFKSSGINITEKQASQFSLYYKLINDNNSDNDLTRIKGEENFIVKHFVDSVYYTKFVDIPDSIIDIGTGAGFPGIPIKIMFPHVNIIFAEQRNRRVDFLKLAVKALGFTGVEFYSHKVTDKSFFNVNGVITRALEDAPETLDRVEHFLPKGGVVILLKGPDADGDIDKLSRKNRDNFKLVIDKKYILPGTDNARRVLVFEKKTGVFRKIYKIMKDENETRGIAVSSSENKTYKDLKKLITGDGIKKTNSITVSGKKIISDFLLHGDITQCRLILPDDYVENDRDFDLLITRFYNRGALYIFKSSLFKEIDVLKNKTPILVTDMPVIEKWDGSAEMGCNPVIPFQDPANVGAAVRSAAGFGVKRIILAKGAANPFHPKSIRASSGAVFKMRFVKGPSIDEFSNFAGKNIPLVSMDKEGLNIEEFTFPESFFLVSGTEGQGLPENLMQSSVSIPVTDSVESLNASVALSIFLYEWSKHKN